MFIQPSVCNYVCSSEQDAARTMMDRIEHDGIVMDGRKLIFHYRFFLYSYLTLISIRYIPI